MFGNIDNGKMVITENDTVASLMYAYGLTQRQAVRTMMGFIESGKKVQVIGKYSRTVESLPHEEAKEAFFKDYEEEV